MKFSLQHKAFAVALSFLMVFSTMSLSMTKHLCFGESIAKVEEDICCSTEKVKEELAEDCCNQTGDCQQCTETEFTIESVEDIQNNSPKLDLVIAYIYTQFFIPTHQKQITPHQNYKVPLLTADITVRDQVFLI